MLTKRVFLSILILFFLAACVTVNIYFPAEAVRRAADEIVEDVYESDKNKDDEGPSGLLERPYQTITLFAEDALAQVDIDISTPAIRSIRSSMEARFSRLKPFYDGGNIGITNKGYIEIKSMDGLDIKASGDIKGLVDAENADRRNLYNEIANANSFGSEAIPEIENLFAQSWQGQASPGWWIQAGNGSWARK